MSSQQSFLTALSLWPLASGSPYMSLFDCQVTLMETARIEVESNATHDIPLIVVARQKRGILSWQIPLIVNSMHFQDLVYNKTSRTLCSTKYYWSEPRDQEEFVALTLSTGSHRNISFKLNMTHVNNFYLRYTILLTLIMRVIR